MRAAFFSLLLSSAAALGGERARIVREVPHHELKLLADCSGDAAAGIHHEIEVAISLGAPTYNRGDFEGCFRTYANTATAIDAREKTCTGVRKALMFGVERASRLRTFDEKAWAMRDAFDGVLDVIERGADAPASPALPKVERHVPTFPAKMLDDCSVANRVKVTKAIQEAIELGAPIYNEGNLEGCARVYLGTAAELQGDLAGCAGVKRALDGAVGQARAQREPAARAWTMRDTFDGLLEVLARKAKATADEI
jgi:hypothetical protein